MPTGVGRGHSQEIVRLRPQAWPNLRIIEIGDAMLGRDGSLIKAVREIYRMQLGLHPELGLAVTSGGRGR